MSSQESVSNLWRKWSLYFRNRATPSFAFYDDAEHYHRVPPPVSLWEDGIDKRGKKRGKVRVIAAKRIEIDARTGEAYEVTDFEDGEQEVCRFATPNTPNEIVFNYGEYVRGEYGRRHLN